jgi:hypothetical protein
VVEVRPGEVLEVRRRAEATARRALHPGDRLERLRGALEREQEGADLGALLDRDGQVEQDAEDPFAAGQIGERERR